MLNADARAKLEMCGPQINQSFKPKSQAAILTRLKFRHLKVAVALRDFASAKLVAEHLNVSQAAISKTISELEDLFGLPLFERVSGEKRPNELGLAVIEQMDMVLLRAKSMAEMVVDIRDGNSGYLTLGVATDIAKLQLARLLPEFTQLHPRIRVEIIAGGLSDMTDALGGGQLDLLFSYRSASLQGAEYRSILVGPQQALVVVANRRLSPFAQGASVTLEDLQSVNWVMPRPGTMIYGHFVAMFENHGLNLPTKGFHTSDFILIDTFIRNTGYLALVPSLAAQRLVATSDAEILPVAAQSKIESLELYWIKARELRSPLRIFRDFCSSRIDRTP